MTREEAIRCLSVHSSTNGSGLCTDKQHFEAKQMAIQALEQELCKDEYIKVPKKALKYRTAGMVAYNVEWLKNHFDIERAVICGAQEPCEDAISRKDAIKQCGFGMTSLLIADCLRKLPSVKPQPCEDAISRKALISHIENQSREWGEDYDAQQILGDIEDMQPVNPQEPNTWSLDDAREDFMHDVYNTLDFLPTNDEANQIIDSFDRVTNSIEQQPCEDCISRQAVLDEAFEVDTKEYGRIEVVGVDAINSLPPVTSQPKIGQWILSGGYWRCSKCKEKALLKLDKSKGNCREYMPVKSNFCPNCGKNMLGIQTSSERNNKK